MKKKTATSATALAAIASGMALAPVAFAGDASRNGELHAALSPIPTSKVTGSGTATVHLKGNQATVTIKTQGLLADAPHAQRFHIGAKGRCPPASAAKQHNGQLSLNTTDGLPFYGKIGASLTTTGDTRADHSARRRPHLTPPVPHPPASREPSCRAVRPCPARHPAPSASPRSACAHRSARSP